MTEAPYFDVELAPVARQIGVAYLHDVDLDAGVELVVGGDVRLRDEGGTLWDATVASGCGRHVALACRPRAATGSAASARVG